MKSVRSRTRKKKEESSCIDKERDQYDSIVKAFPVVEEKELTEEDYSKVNPKRYSEDIPIPRHVIVLKQKSEDMKKNCSYI